MWDPFFGPVYYIKLYLPPDPYLKAPPDPQGNHTTLKFGDMVGHPLDYHYLKYESFIITGLGDMLCGILISGGFAQLYYTERWGKNHYLLQGNHTTLKSCDMVQHFMGYHYLKYESFIITGLGDIPCGILFLAAFCQLYYREHQSKIHYLHQGKHTTLKFGDMVGHPLGYSCLNYELFIITGLGDISCGILF